MSLVGKYSCPDLEATLTITDAQSYNGTGKGIFSMKGMTINVHLNFHYQNDIGPSTNYRLSGSKGGSDDPNQYVGMAGFSDTQDAANGINLAGGLATADQADSFSGLFKRV